jgi:hypothetical protein
LEGLFFKIKDFSYNKCIYRIFKICICIYWD